MRSGQYLVRLWHLAAFDIWDVQNGEPSASGVAAVGFLLYGFRFPSGTRPFTATAACIIRFCRQILTAFLVVFIAGPKLPI